jgi:flavorubredoxin
MYMIQGRGAIIFDTGLEKTREKYLDAFSEACIRPGEITLIVVTRGDETHFFSR